MSERACWICSQPHNPDKWERRACAYDEEPKCRHREPEVELAIERARRAAETEVSA